jgi:hypothetical protein
MNMTNSLKDETDRRRPMKNWFTDALSWAPMLQYKRWESSRQISKSTEHQQALGTN